MKEYIGKILTISNGYEFTIIGEIKNILYSDKEIKLIIDFVKEEYNKNNIAEEFTIDILKQENNKLKNQIEKITEQNYYINKDMQCLHENFNKIINLSFIKKLKFAFGLYKNKIFW